MTKHITTTEMWAGTDESYDLFSSAQAQISAFVSSGKQAPEQASLLEVSGGVGVVSIHGPISNSDSPWNALLGMTSYPAINKALIEAATNPDVKSVVLDMATPGGAVSGVVDTAALIDQINTKVKPVDAYAADGALSAGYWLASSAGKIYASKTASIGSVGIITTHAERSAQLKDAGVAVTVLRAGKYKALASAVEPLTTDARDQIQKSLDAAYGVFAEHVAQARGMSMPVFEATAGQGRVFLGTQAQDVGLIDGVKSFSDVFNEATKKAATSKGSLRAESPPNLEGVNPTMSLKNILTDQAIAAIAAGAALTPEQTAALAATAETEGADDDAVTANPAAGADTAATEAAAATAAAATAVPAATVVDVLQAQITAKDSALVDARVAIKALEAQVADLTKAQGPLLEIAGKSLSNLTVALGGAATSIEGRSASDVLAEHARLSATFSNKFKAGGVAATAAVEAVKEVKHVSDSLHKARIAATQPK